jgi:hypothetical protein
MEDRNMESFQEYVDEYRAQLAKGAIQKAYRGLMAYIMGLRTHLKTKYPDYFVSGSIYYGYMDMTYFSFFPESLKRRNLKIAIVFIECLLVEDPDFRDPDALTEQIESTALKLIQDVESFLAVHGD